MNDEFGKMVDLLRSELDAEEAARLRDRIAHDDALLAQFEGLRRTFAVLGCLPGLGSSGSHDNSLARLDSEMTARNWAGILPQVVVSSELVKIFRIEFAVRSVVAAIPPLEPTTGFCAALERAFVVLALTNSVPSLPVRSEFAGELRTEMQTRALCAGLPMLPVPDVLRRRIRVAISEAAVGDLEELLHSDTEPVAPVLEPSDGFRRRLFAAVTNSRRIGFGAPFLRTGEDAFRREIGRAFRKSRRPIAAAALAHLLLVVVGFFLTTSLILTADTEVMRASVESGVTPELGEATRRTLNGPWGDESPEGPAKRGVSDADRPEFDARFVDESEFPVRLEDVVEEDYPVGMAVEPKRHKPLDRKDYRTQTAGWFELREESQEEKERRLGSRELIAALERSLRYLQRTQQPDGSWGLIEIEIEPREPALMEVRKLELTSAALLAMLGDGHDSAAEGGRFAENVRDGIEYLLSMQLENGRIGPAELPIVLVHSMATLALLEDFAMTRNPRLRRPIARAVEWLVGVQPLGGGDGFPHRTGAAPSLMTGVWSYMALATAVELRVPSSRIAQSRLEGLLKWFRSQTRAGDELEPDEYNSDMLYGRNVPAAAGATLAAWAGEADTRRGKRLFSAISKNTPSLRPGELPGDDSNDMRYLFFGGQAFHLADRHGETGGEWLNAASRALLQSQVKEGPLSGSFPAGGEYGSLYGRVYGAAYAALSIESPFRLSLIRR